MEGFERFRFSVPAVPLRRGFLCVSAQFHREDGSGSGFGSWKTVPAVPVPRSVPAKTVPTVPVPVRFLGHPDFSASGEPPECVWENKENPTTLEILSVKRQMVQFLGNLENPECGV